MRSAPPKGCCCRSAATRASGLAVMLGLLAGPLNRAAFGRDVIDFNADDASETNTGHFIIALDVARFLPLADYTAEVDRHIRELKESKRLPGVDEIRMPGERRRACREERCATACRSRPPLVAQLDKMAGELGERSTTSSCARRPRRRRRHACASIETRLRALRLSYASSGSFTGCFASPTDPAPWSASGSCALRRSSRPASAGRARRD